MFKIKTRNYSVPGSAPALLAFVFLSATCANAGYITTTLGVAGPSNFAILALTGVQDFALNGPGTTNGNVGDNGSNNLQLNASGGHLAINGNLILGTNATVNNTAQVTGSVLNQNLSAANAAALAAASTFSGLAATLPAITTITGTTIINGIAGNNVINISNLNLGNGETLTLNGPAGAQFIINDSGGFVLNSGLIRETGGVTSTDVVINLTSSATASTSGGLNNESVINGILLAPTSNIAFAPGLVNGELIAGGRSLHLVSGASVNQPNIPSVPEPSTWLSLLTGIAIVGWTSIRKASTVK